MFIIVTSVTFTQKNLLLAYQKHLLSQSLKGNIQETKCQPNSEKSSSAKI